eukprot:6489268-Alexandrium_andersonii.AAC.1
MTRPTFCGALRAVAESLYASYGTPSTPGAEEPAALMACPKQLSSQVGQSGGRASPPARRS